MERLSSTNSIYKKRRQGYSLPEVLLTVSLMCMLLGLGFTSFNDAIKSQNVEAAAGQIEKAMKKARYYSRSKGVVTTLSFPAGSETFSITADDENLINTNYFDAMSGELPAGTKIISNYCCDLSYDVKGNIIDSYGYVMYYDCAILVGYQGGTQKMLVISAKSGNVSYE